VSAQLAPGSFDQSAATFAPHWKVAVFADETALDQPLVRHLSRLKLPGEARSGGALPAARRGGGFLAPVLRHDSRVHLGPIGTMLKTNNFFQPLARAFIKVPADSAGARSLCRAGS
jgi:hypothetical protein